MVVSLCVYITQQYTGDSRRDQIGETCTTLALSFYDKLCRQIPLGFDLEWYIWKRKQELWWRKFNLARMNAEIGDLFVHEIQTKKEHQVKPNDGFFPTVFLQNQKG